MDERLDARPPTSEVPSPRSLAGQTNGKAIASLVLGIVGLTGIPFVCSIIAIVLGRRAREEIRTTGEGGEGLATAGLVLGWVGATLVLVAALLIGGLVAVNVVGSS